jgi:hypothetical protein
LVELFVLATSLMVRMIDYDIYSYKPCAEEFLKTLKVKLQNDHPTIKVYISTANPYEHWIKVRRNNNEVYISETRVR